MTLHSGAARMVGRGVVVVVVLLVAAIAFAGVAEAHVTVVPTAGTPGADAVLTFRVPNETDEAATTQVVVALPPDHPIASVSVRPTSGWTVQVQRRALAHPLSSDEGSVTETVSRIVWRAEDAASRIGPGQFQEFAVSVGPLPRTPRLIFKVLQYYSDGTVVRWIDPPTKGPESPHPAPVFMLRAPPGLSTDASAADRTAFDPATKRFAVAGLSGAGLALFVAGAALLAVSRRRGPA